MTIRTLATDKEFLRGIVNNGFRIPDSINLRELAVALMPNLRSSDGELRDDLSYTILSQILKRESFTTEDLSEILASSISEEYLFWGIGQCDTDTVFARTFAVLIVAEIVEFDAAVRQLLGPKQIHRTVEAVLDYTKRERDYRGYVDDDKGWAHSVAHMSYALDSCAHHPLTTQEERVEILDSIFTLATLPAALTFMEADHLSRVVFRMIKDKQVSTDQLSIWIKRFDLELDRTGKTVLKNVNASDFLKSLYFLLSWEQPNHALMSVISEQIKRLNIWYRHEISFES